MKSFDNRAVKGLSVNVRNNDVNGALRKLKKRVQEDGRLQEVRAKEHYVKPSVKRKRAAGAARARHLKSKEKALKELQQNRDRRG